VQAELGLDYYVARWYDPTIGHFTQADAKIPNIWEITKSSECVNIENRFYSALAIDVSKTAPLNHKKTNYAKFINNTNSQQKIPYNPIVFDRYTYSPNNFLKFIDPTDYDPQEVIIGISILVSIGVSISAPEIIIIGGIVVLTVLIVDAVTPGAEQRHEDINSIIGQKTNSIKSQISSTGRP
jgi:hypothetical protein